MNKDLGGLIIVGLLLWVLFRQQSPPTQVSNEETWTWVDWQGKERSITVHRNVNATG